MFTKVKGGRTGTQKLRSRTLGVNHSRWNFCSIQPIEIDFTWISKFQKFLSCVFSYRRPVTLVTLQTVFPVVNDNSIHVVFYFWLWWSHVTPVLNNVSVKRYVCSDGLSTMCYKNVQTLNTWCFNFSFELLIYGYFSWTSYGWEWMWREIADFSRVWEEWLYLLVFQVKWVHLFSDSWSTSGHILEEFRSYVECC